MTHNVTDNTTTVKQLLPAANDNEFVITTMEYGTYVFSVHGENAFGNGSNNTVTISKIINVTCFKSELLQMFCYDIICSML